ncbi:MAG TPA: nucleotidyltransferase substrate binding protein [Hanamia sp.]|nr:nucleotidyltransferase substrate binding protein [Hanamia sp.]
MEKMERWKERLKSYSKALFQLESALQQKQFSVLEKDGVIKRFEFTFELAWKTLQDKLYDEGYLTTKGPKPVIKQAFKNGMITDGQAWMDMLTDRNNSTHLYEESAAVSIFDRIQITYFKLLQELKSKLENE